MFDERSMHCTSWNSIRTHDKRKTKKKKIENQRAHEEYTIQHTDAGIARRETPNLMRTSDKTIKWEAEGVW